MAGLPPHTLMQRAGRAVARAALAAFPRACSVQALAGPGNNGGDAIVAATALACCGWQVRVKLLSDAARQPADAAWALAQAHQAGVPIDTQDPFQPTADLLIDGLLGLGASRAPSGRLADAIAVMNASSAPVLAIDLPSGLEGDSGHLLGSTAVRANMTLSLLTLKPGLFTGQGRDHAGTIWHDDLGLELPPSPLALLGAGWLDGPAAHVSHKGSFGDVMVVGGAEGMAGAVFLAGRAALAAGAGRVYVALAEHPSTDATRCWPELMTSPLPNGASASALASQTVVAGCGGGCAFGQQLPPLLAHAARLVLDADALNAIAVDAALATLLQARAARGRPTVLTPHPLEAARLLGIETAAVQADRIGAARALVRRFGCLVVLKGSGSIVAGPGDGVALNPTGNALLATPGSGDVLAGWIGGNWARMHGSTALPVIVGASVWRHGHAADLARRARPGWPTLQAGELVDLMRDALP